MRQASATNNPALALLAAFGAGVLGSLIYAILTVSFKANQNVTGLTLTIFGTGIYPTCLAQLAPSGALGEGVMSVFKSVSIPVCPEQSAHVGNSCSLQLVRVLWRLRCA